MSRLAALALILGTTAMAQPYQQTLISVGRNVNLAGWETSAKAVTPDCPVAWTIKKVTLHGGKQEGVELILLDNGKLQAVICPTRGMGIMSVRMGDIRLGWDSPVKETVHPRHINLQSRGGLGWLEGFNEWMVRCGLESNGHPGTDKFVNNVGDEATMELTLHGKIANIPASEVEVLVEKQAPYRITVRGRVDERMFYGPKLEMWTTFSTEPGSNSFRISDTVTNRGGAEQEFQMLYHANFGAPLLEEGARCVTAAERVTPFNENAAKWMSTWDTYAGPKLGFVEQVYCVKPLAGADGKALAMLANKGGDKGVLMSFNTAELPYLTVWKNTNAVEEGYVTGIEPGTGFPYNRRIERKAGRVPKLAAGAARSFTLDFSILGAVEVKAVGEGITALQAKRPATIEPAPVKVE